MSEPSLAYSIIPANAAPSQAISTSLAGQQCLIVVYTKSIYALVPDEVDGSVLTYQNLNPCFVDLYVNNVIVVGGVYVRQGSLIVRDTYLGFSGDLAVYDTSGLGQDPYGVPPRLPPYGLRNRAQRQTFPLSDGDQAPASVAGTIPGFGTRFVLTYWPVGSYTPGYPPPPPSFG